MIERLYMFKDLNRDSNTYSLENAHDWKPCKIISMGQEEDAYLFSMQLMLGEMNIIPFQKFHDDYWVGDDKNATGRRYERLSEFLSGFIFCTDPRLLDYMMSYRGDLDWQKSLRERKHWSQGKAQHSLLDRFLI